MDNKVSQEESPESRPNIRCNDGTLFVYTQDSGHYEPYIHSDSKNADANPVKTPRHFLPVDVKRDSLAFWVTTLLSVITIIIVATYTNYARIQAKASTDAVRQASDAMKLDQRAWVGVYEVKSIPSSTDTSISFENTGKTPAINFSVAASSSDSKDSEERPIPGNSVIVPSGKFHSNVVFEDESKKTKMLYVHGTVRYWTIFGNQHWTRFCYLHEGDSLGFSPCDSGNAVDSNAP